MVLVMDLYFTHFVLTTFCLRMLMAFTIQRQGPCSSWSSPMHEHGTVTLCDQLQYLNYKMPSMAVSSAPYPRDLDSISPSVRVSLADCRLSTVVQKLVTSRRTQTAKTRISNVCTDS